jgi:hypothetical protein
MFLAVGVLASLVVAPFYWRAARWKGVIVTLIAIAALYWVGDTNLSLRSGSAWWQEPFWRNMILFALLLLGMLFRTFWEALERRSLSPQHPGGLVVGLSAADFLRPVLVSLIVFQGVLLLAKSQELSWELSLASFQNGFFWNTLFGRTRRAMEGDHPVENQPKAAASSNG